MSASVKYCLVTLTVLCSLLLLITLTVPGFSTLSLKDLSPTYWGKYLVDQQLIPQGPQGVVILFVVLTIATAIGLPRQIAAFISGYSLGGLSGALVATLAATSGCLLTFSAARHLFRLQIQKKYPQKISKISAFIGQQTLVKTIVIRLLPLGSNLITNIVAGVTRVSAKRYLLGSFLGFIPQMLIFSFAGSGVQ